MKKPQGPPTQGEIWQKVGADPTVLNEILSKVSEPTAGGEYLHWDQLRYLDPPEGLSHHVWWFGLKLHRIGQAKQIPLLDIAEHPFAFTLADPLPECLHHIDSHASGIVQMPEPVVNPDTRRSYIVRSLIEEAITSSQLEGASTTREVAKKMIREARPPRDRSEQMIMNNFHTMQRISRVKEESLSRDLVFEIHRMVTEKTLDDPSGAGRFRRSEEDIVVGDDTGEIFHSPPPAEQLEPRMQTMCDFANGAAPQGFIHPLIRSIVLHFWLAYDHPFIDGNGRTARALFYWSMLRYGYWLFEYISISRIILKGPVQYGLAFLYTETDENDLTYFLLYHADVIRRAIDELYQYIERRSQQLRKAEAEVRGLTILNHRQRELISHALHHPGQQYYVESHRTSHDVVYETARSDLMDLVDRGLLRKRKIGKVWNFTPVEDLESRLRRS